MFTAFLWRDKLLYLIREKDGADFIIVLNSRKCDCSGNLGNHLAFFRTCGTEIAAGGNIHKKHHRELALLLIYLNIWLIVAGGYIPVDIADIIAVLICAHLRERHAATFESRMIFASKDVLGKSACLYFNLANFFYKFIGIHIRK